jgi:hypothetical protein
VEVRQIPPMLGHMRAKEIESGKRRQFLTLFLNGMLKHNVI